MRCDLEDIATAVSKILENKEAISQIRDLLGDNQNNGNSNENNAGQSGDEQNFPDIDFGKIFNIFKCLNGSNKNSDPGVNLIHALIPFLSEERRRNANEAEKILRIIKMIPMLKEMGILDNLFGGDDSGKT